MSVGGRPVLRSNVWKEGVRGGVRSFGTLPIPWCIQWWIYIVKFWTRPPPGPNSFNFMQFWGKFGKIVCWCPPWRVGAPSSGKSWIRHWHMMYPPHVNRQTPVKTLPSRNFVCGRETFTKWYRISDLHTPHHIQLHHTLLTIHTWLLIGHALLTIHTWLRLLFAMRAQTMLWALPVYEMWKKSEQQQQQQTAYANVPWALYEWIYMPSSPLWNKQQ